MDITRAKIRDLRKALDSKEISAAELCGEYFKKIEAGDGKVQSYITVTRDKAMEMAANAQKRIDARRIRPPHRNPPRDKGQHLHRWHQDHLCKQNAGEFHSPVQCHSN